MKIRDVWPRFVLGVSIVSVGSGVIVMLMTDQSVGFSEIGKGGEYVGSIAAIVQRGRWCEYRIEAGKDVVKIITNASRRSEEWPDDDRKSEYGLRYQLLDQENKRVVDERAFLQTRKVFEFLPSLWKFVLAEEFGTTLVTPLSPRVTLVALDALEGKGGTLRLSCDSGDEDIVDLCVRVYARTAPGKRGRTRDGGKSSPPGGNAARNVGVSGESVNKVASGQGQPGVEWSSLGPLGIRGRDYLQRRILVCKGRKTTADGEPVQRLGLQVRAGSIGIVRDEEQVVRSRWEVYPPGGLQGFGGADTARVRVWRADGKGKEEHRVGLNGEGVREIIEGAATQFEIEATTDIVVRVFALNDGMEREITPQRMLSRYEVLEGGDDRIFRLKSDGRSQLVVKIDARLLWTRSGLPKPERCALWYAIVGERGFIHYEGEIPVEGRAAVSAWPEGAFKDWQTSEPNVWFLGIPAGARALVLVARSEVLAVACHWNAADSVRTIRIPGASGRDARGLEEGCGPAGGWLPLVPGRASGSPGRCEEVFVTDQEESTLQHEEQNHRRFTLVSLVPDGACRTREVLVPAREQRRVDNGIHAGRWMAFATGKSHLVRFDGGDRFPEGDMGLLWLGENSTSGRLSVRIDGVPWVGRALGSAATPVLAVPLAAGWHELSLDGPPGGMVLARGIVEGGGQRYWQRTCHELDKPVSFAGVKEGNERDVLVARVYVRGTESRGTRISVNLAFERSTGSVMASWTSRRTVLDLEAPLGRCRADCLAGGSEYVCERVFRIVLGSDVLPGPYMVTMQHEGGAECLLHLARRIEDDGVDPGWLAVTGQAGE